MVIRRRVLSESQGLPVFDVSNPFAHICKLNARVDKFEIRYPNQRLQYINPAELQAFTQTLANTTGFSRLGRNTNGVKFSNDVALDGERVYFNSRGNGAGTAHFPIVISANYNRFYQANNITSTDYGGDFSLEQNSADIFGDDLTELFLSEHPNLIAARSLTLDRNDNILIRPRWQETQNVLSLLPLQICLIQQFIESQFDVNSQFPISDAPIEEGQVSRAYLEQARTVPILNWTNYTIPHLEICWDFHCKDAIAVAKRYQQPMQQITTHMKTRYHHHTSETHHNAVSHSAKLIQNVKLGIYAKTQTRLRFEVVYHQKSIKSIFQQQLRGVNDMRSIVDFMLDDATGKLMRFMQALHRQSTPVTADRAERLTALLKHLCRATGGEFTRLQENALMGVFSLLTQSGRIVVGHHEVSRYATILDRLEREQILERVNRQRGVKTRTYSFTPAYHWLLTGMTG